MSTFPKATKRTSKPPPFLKLARAFYGDAFGARRAKELSEAMADWSELTEDEQSFTLAHLHYLDLLAQARTQRLLVQIRDLLDEVVDNLGDVLDERENEGFAGDEGPDFDDDDLDEDEELEAGDEQDFEPEDEPFDDQDSDHGQEAGSVSPQVEVSASQQHPGLSGFAAGEE